MPLQEESQMTAVMPVPSPIPTPPDFPIEWPTPEAALLFWQQDRMHAPLPMTPMSAWLTAHFAVGFNEGLARLGQPIGTNVARINTYFYMSIGPNVPPDQMAELEAQAEPILRAALENFWSRWEAEWLPEIQQYWREWEALNLSGATDDELSSHASRLIEIYERLWAIHMEVLLPAMAGISAFHDLYADLFPERNPLDAYRLLQGFDNKSLEAGRELWKLSRLAHNSAEMSRLIGETPSDDLAAELEKSSEGRAFKLELDRYLSFYGRRSDTVQELADVSWTENPAPVFNNLKAYLKQDEDPAVLTSAHAEERERLIAEARETLNSYPAPVRGQFELLLTAGQAMSRLQEDHNFWIDQRSLHEVRQFCLEIGRRLVARGSLRQPDDVFMFSMDEALDLLLGRWTEGQAVADERRQEMKHWEAVAAPPVAGMDYGPPPDNPMTRALMRFFGGPVPQSGKSDELQGNSGSPGKITGTARIVMTLAEAGRLEKGDILVTPTTAPPWTPLFATAGGIVTETGGVLSHCAIVAREYGIPAVVGAAGATSIIKDGSVIEVDGDTGSIRIIS
jgi:rifampicin phosphotransferase